MTNILRPELAWIEGRCYRLNEPMPKLSDFEEHNLYEEDGVYEEMDDEENDDFKVMMIGDSRYSTNLHIPKQYIGSVIGKRGATKMRIEHETKTTIQIPKQGNTGDVVILGSSARNVKSARKRIENIVISSREKHKSHFVGIPVKSSTITDNFEKFKEAVLKDCPDSGIEESMFTKVVKLHITVGITCLMDSEEREFVSKLLSDASEQFVMPLLRGHSPLKIRMQGLSYMNDDPQKVHVLFANVREEDESAAGLLQQLADELLKHFNKAGFMKKNYGRDSVKLHVTLINTRYKNKDMDDDTVEQKFQQRVPFDASKVLENFSNYDFGVATLTEIHLSEMNVYDDTGYYRPTFVISCTK